MMLEKQLIKYRIFSRVGAYSINQEKPKDVHAALSYTVSLLNQPSSPRPLVCIFPQGELLPWGIRPLGYQKGMEWIIHKYGHPLNILPLAIRSEFCSQQLPEVFLMFGENYQFSSANFPGIAWLEKIQTDLLNTLANSIIKKVNGTVLLNGRRSINQTFDIIRRKN
jgi:chlorobactene lauroyltransferase